MEELKMKLLFRDEPHYFSAVGVFANSDFIIQLQIRLIKSKLIEQIRQLLNTLGVVYTEKAEGTIEVLEEESKVKVEKLAIHASTDELLALIDSGKRIESFSLPLDMPSDRAMERVAWFLNSFAIDFTITPQGVIVIDFSVAY
jgi:hypothetical protein